MWTAGIAAQLLQLRQIFFCARKCAELNHRLTLDRKRIANGLPTGSAENIVTAYESLVAEHVVGIIGPGVTDNCLIAAELSSRYRVEFGNPRPSLPRK